MISPFRFFVFLAALLCATRLQAQNLFDREHTMAFAHYLFASGQYKHAAREYERVVFMDAPNDSAKLMLVRSYRKSGEPARGLARFNVLFDSAFVTQRPLLREWSYLHITTGNYTGVEHALENNSRINAADKAYVMMNMSLFRKQWKTARHHYEQGVVADAPLFQPYTSLVYDALNMKRRSPVVAGGLSMAVPGAGKFYVGQWKDGLIALAMTGATAYQAYRGYDQKGIESPKFWVYGGLATGFYLGNIYGSARAARKYNQKREHEIVERTRRLYMLGD